MPELVLAGIQRGALLGFFSLALVVLLFPAIYGLLRIFKHLPSRQIPLKDYQETLVPGCSSVFFNHDGNRFHGIARCPPGSGISFVVRQTRIPGPTLSAPASDRNRFIGSMCLSDGVAVSFTSTGWS